MKLRRNKKNTDENKQKCESPDCLSPDVYYEIEDFYKVEGKNFCQFCYTKHLSEQITEQVIETPKTKKIDKVETNRISSKPNNWDLNNQSSSNISRIGPPSISEKYLEELKIWSDLLNFMKYDLDVNKITKFNYSQQMRILETSQGYFLLILSTPDEKKLKEEEYNIYNLVIHANIPKFTSLELSKLSNAQKDWFITNQIVSSQDDLNNQLLVALKIDSDIITPLEDFTIDTNIIDVQTFLSELGKSYYLFNFIGCSPPKVIIVQNQDSYSFLTTNKIFAKESFSQVQLAIRELSLSIPYLLDKEKLEAFLEGAANTQKKIEEIFEQDQKTKKLILNFFTKYHINFDEKKHLIPLDFNLKE